MGASVLIPAGEYLRSTYRPDCDYVQGELRGRNVGELPHSTLQGFLYSLFRKHKEDWQILPATEQRVQTGSDNYRIADVCVLRASDPKTRITRVPPLVCIEILSSEDRMGDLQKRVDDYAAMGVPNIWVIDPWKRFAYYASPHGFEQPPDQHLRVPGTPIAISLAELFAELDGLEVD